MNAGWHNYPLTDPNPTPKTRVKAKIFFGYQSASGDLSVKPGTASCSGGLSQKVCVGLYHNLNRYYDPDTGRYLSVDPSREGNGYSYALNNPLVGIDPIADVTIIVHGTFAVNEKWASREGTFAKAAAKYFGDVDIQSFDWCGSDYTAARQIAGNRLKAYIDLLRDFYGPKEKINVIAHSHGGNVVKWATLLGATMDRVVNLGTPQNGTRFNRANVGEVINAYSREDIVQKMGGKYRIFETPDYAYEGGPAGRIDLQADRNIEVYSGTFWWRKPLSTHSRLHSAMIFQQIKER